MSAISDWKAKKESGQVFTSLDEDDGCCYRTPIGVTAAPVSLWSLWVTGCFVLCPGTIAPPAGQLSLCYLVPEQACRCTLNSVDGSHVFRCSPVMHEHSELHNSMSHNGSCWVDCVRVPATQPCRIWTLWCEVIRTPVSYKLQVPLMLYSISVLMPLCPVKILDIKCNRAG